MAPAAEGGKKKNDATVPIVIVIVGFLLLLLFGGCGNISLPSFGTGTGSGSGSSHPSHWSGYHCDPNRYDCRGHFERDGRWISDDQRDDGQHHGSGHRRTKPRPTDDPDPPEDR